MSGVNGESHGKFNEKNNYQIWYCYSFWLVIIPVFVVHIFKWIATGKIDLFSLIMDFLLMGFSISVSVISYIAGKYTSNEEKITLRPRAIGDVGFGFLFLVTHIVYQCIVELSVIRIVFLGIVCVSEIAAILYIYFFIKRYENSKGN